MTLNFDWFELFADEWRTTANSSSFSLSYWRPNGDQFTSPVESIKEFIMPDAFSLSQFIVQPSVNTQYDQVDGFETFHLVVDGDEYSNVTFSRAGGGGVDYLANKYWVDDIDVTFTAGKIIKLWNRKFADPNDGVDLFRVSLTGTWLRD